tara:strand:- start:189 stop:371 length:183 start_codon:yes stop_codon:yes gene_type:complete
MMRQKKQMIKVKRLLRARQNHRKTPVCHLKMQRIKNLRRKYKLSNLTLNPKIPKRSQRKR